MLGQFVQNPHDHPLLVVYTGQWSLLADKLAAAFGPASTTKMEVEDAAAAMSSVMGIHFQHRDEEYLVLASLKDGDLLCAINHRFHDVASLGLLAGGARLIPCLVPEGVLKRPLGTPPDMKPSAWTTAKMSKAFLEEFSGKLSRNEAAFLATTIAISNYCQDFPEQGAQRLMCLHSLRKVRGQAASAGGDYSCFVQPFVIEVGAPVTASESGVARVQTYFEKLRANELLLKEPAEVQEPYWMFDTWLNSGACHQEGVSLSPSLFHLYSVVCRDFAMCVENLDGSVEVHLYCDRNGVDISVVTNGWTSIQV
eukprot:TRINITY_DN48190_c0_g1_i1.p1 TRINITY_DN48190_c0_g1~~TRINITY_DN48190_c0_g1_i1.p1  ORF type:complete len:310 (-),score=61.58 TRINITY_DN48190_c0_g1_i1:69-998(-)